MHEIREVCQFMSVPLLPTGEERFRAKGALPAIPRSGNGWCDGALDSTEGRRGKVGVWPGVDMAGPLLDELMGCRALAENLCKAIIASLKCVPVLGGVVAVPWQIVVHSGNRKDLEENEEARTALCHLLGGNSGRIYTASA